MELNLSQKEKDQKLWQRLQDGDQSALSLIYKQNASLLSAYGFRLTDNREIINDAIQDIFIKLLQKSQELPNVQNPKAYLIKSLRNRILRILESRNFSEHGEQPHEGIQDAHENYIIQEELNKEQLHKLHTSLQKLPIRQKEVIHLKYYQNLTTDEIAEVLNINYQSVSNLLYKGIKSLKKQIKMKKRSTNPS